MQIKIKKQNKDGVVRVETSGIVKEILVNEDFMHPQNETVALCFRGKDSSGIVELKTDELESLYDEIKKRIHLIKGFKRISSTSGARLI
ncbi:MAG: hypothetical protein KKF44_03375 [Nanoarchaeota archaeon]|nr:hypothetical protein [Nanoarchaeota archaeon]